MKLQTPKAMKERIYSLFLTLFAFSMLALPMQAQDAEEEPIRERMLARVAAVDALKIAGQVGENNAGLLEQRGNLSRDERAVLNAENADRRALYTVIAKRLGLTLTVVGQGRAEELRQRSAPGVWLQNRQGEWYQKEA